MDAAAAQAAAEDLLRAARDPAVVSTAERAVGLARKELGDVAGAHRHLRRAIAVAERAGEARRAAQARMSVAAILSARGAFEPALAQLDRAATALEGHDAAQLLAQRGLILSREGRRDEALTCFRQALPVLRRAGDHRFEALLLLNRGALLAMAGDLTAAEADLHRCVDVATAAGLRRLAAFAEDNLGFVAARRGDLPTALASFDRAESFDSADLVSLGATCADRAQALLTGRLARDAAVELRRAISLFEACGAGHEAANARLMLAEAALLDRDPAGALAAAEAAAAQLRRQRRGGWAALADHVALRARVAAGERSPGLVAAARRNATRLDGTAWREAALRSRLLAGRVLLDLGRPAEATRELSRAAAARGRGPADLRAAAWHAEALVRLAAGNRRGALAAARAGLRVVEDHAAVLGASELRAYAAGHGEELAELGLRIVLDGGRPSDVLAWSERFRARGLQRPPARPSGDRRLADDLASLRRVSAEIEAAITEGRDSGGLDAERRRLERAVRDRARHAHGPTGHAASGRAGTPAERATGGAALHDLLGRRALLSYFRAGPGLHAVSAVDGRVRLHDLGPYERVLRELEGLRFCLHRLARRHGSPGSLDAAAAGLAHAAATLDGLLLGGPGAHAGERPLVIVPTMALHALPWTVLPSARGRSVEVAPSAHLWARAAARGGSSAGTTVLAAGPGLRYAAPEIAALAELHPGARVLLGADAGADAVREAMDGAALVHLACHGRFRGENPQFSCLELADGPLTVYDLERLRRAPDTVVLSACDSALSAVHPGDELMGMAAAMFALGTRTLIASVTPVPDAATGTLMLDLHRRLRAGGAPALSLAEAGAATGIDGFVCFGAG